MGYAVLLIPIKPTELMIGIAVMCCVPTVLASSAILADQVNRLLIILNCRVVVVLH